MTNKGARQPGAVLFCPHTEKKVQDNSASVRE